MSCKKKCNYVWDSVMAILPVMSPAPFFFFVRLNNATVINNTKPLKRPFFPPNVTDSVYFAALTSVVLRQCVPDGEKWRVVAAAAVSPSGRGSRVMAVLRRPLPRLTRWGRSAWNFSPLPVSIRSSGVLCTGSQGHRKQINCAFLQLCLNVLTG